MEFRSISLILLVLALFFMILNLKEDLFYIIDIILVMLGTVFGILGAKYD